jgi:hypothetical protein
MGYMNSRRLGLRHETHTNNCTQAHALTRTRTRRRLEEPLGIGKKKFT